METKELIKQWQDSERSLEKLWTLNLQCIEMVQTQKAKSKLNTLAIFKLLVIAIGIIYVFVLGFLVYGNHLRNLYFSISIGIIILINIITILVYIRHILLIRNISLSENLVDTQQKIAVLQLSTLAISRILWLQLPFWSTWFWNSHWIANSLNFWLIPFPITIFFILLALWLYKNISLENSRKKWFRVLFNSTEWLSITSAMAFMEEIESFKQNE
jgi:hypothetical protein